MGNRWTWKVAQVVLALTVLSACGGSAPASSGGTTTASADDGSGSTSGGETSSGTRRRRRRSHGSSSASASGDEGTSESSESTSGDELPLDEATLVEGTGVTVRPPRGSQPLPVGAGFVHVRRRIQMVVAVAQGDEDVRRAVADSLGADADELSHEEVTIDGRATRLVVDSQMMGDTELERMWILMTDGDRAMAIVAAYLADRSERLRPLVRASLLSTHWDTTVALEPERAVGFRLATPPEGLVVEPQVVSTLTYAPPGMAPTPASGHPALLVVPVPMQLPADQRTAACERILLQVGPVSEDTVTARSTIDEEGTTGCEVMGAQELDAPTAGGPSEIATYAALVFVGDAPFMVAGFVDAAQRETWLPRFSAGARTVGPTPR